MPSSARVPPSARPRSLHDALPIFFRGPARQELIVPAGWSSVRLVSIGLPAEDVAAVRASGLGLVARVANFTAADEPAIRAVAHRLRSEEHTSELQSPYDLVCRLLLVSHPRRAPVPYTTLFRSSSAARPARN